MASNSASVCAGATASYSARDSSSKVNVLPCSIARRARTAESWRARYCRRSPHIAASCPATDAGAFASSATSPAACWSSVAEWRLGLLGFGPPLRRTVVGVDVVGIVLANRQHEPDVAFRHRAEGSAGVLRAHHCHRRPPPAPRTHRPNLDVQPLSHHSPVAPARTCSHLSHPCTPAPVRTPRTRAPARTLPAPARTYPRYRSRIVGIRYS